jgi:outer membrane protein TolC
VYRHTVLLLLLGLSFLLTVPGGLAKKPANAAKSKAVLPTVVLDKELPDNAWPEDLFHLQNHVVNGSTLLLTDVLGATLTYHPELDAARARLGQSEAKKLEKQGAFDIKLDSDTAWNRYQTSSAVGKAKNTFQTINKLSWLSRSGIQLSAGNKLNNGDVSSSFSPTGDNGETFIEARVPLLKGLVQNKAKAGEQKASLKITEFEAGLIKKRLELLEKAGSSYWKWFAAGQSLQITQTLLQLSQERLTGLKRQVELGDKSLFEQLEAEQEVQRRAALLAEEENRFLKSAQDLKLFLWNPQTRLPVEQAPPLPALPSVLPKAPLYTEQLLEQGKILAYQRQPELKILKIGQQLSTVDWKLAKNQLLPQLDAVVKPGYQPGETGIGPTLQAGIELSVPLQRRSAKGQVMYAQLKLDELDAKEKMLLATIQIQLTQATIGIQQAGKQLEKTGQQMDLALKLSEGERRRFELGDSTLFLVNTRERQAAKAQKDHLKATQKLMMAWLNYWIETVQL